MKPKIFVLCAPSGAGKSTLIRRIMPLFPFLTFSISATTRHPRGEEKDGREYFFKSKEAFEQMIANDELAEWQEVFGHYYGTPKSFLLERIAEGKSIIMDIDVYGKTLFDKAFPKAVGIFVTVGSLDILQERLLKRKTESPEDLAKRVSKAREEMEYAEVQGKFEYTIINEDLETAVMELDQIIREETEA